MLRILYLGLLIGVLSFSMSISFAEKEDLIPNWIKDVAGFWSDDQISDKDFLLGIEYLIKNGFIKVSNSNHQSGLNESDIILTVYTNKAKYGSLDDIVIFGTVSTLVDSQMISIVVHSPNSNFLSIEKILPNSDGSYAFVAKDLKFKEHGTYTVNVYYAGQSHAATSYQFVPIV